MAERGKKKAPFSFYAFSYYLFFLIEMEKYGSDVSSG